MIEIDNDDEKYLEMLRELIFDDGYIEQKEQQLEKFLINIFEQDKERAYRRPRGPKGGVVLEHENRLRFCNRFYGNKLVMAVKKIMYR